MEDDCSREAGGSAIKRRRVLQSVGAGSAMAGLTGLATATGKPKFTANQVDKVTQGYEDIDAVTETLAEKTELLQAVANEGYIESASVDALDIETLGEADTEGDSKVVIDALSVDGEITPDVLVAKAVSEGRLIISVKPEFNSAFALIEKEGTDDFIDIYKLNPCFDRCDEDEECVRNCRRCAKACVECQEENRYNPHWSCECVEDCGGGGW